MFADLEAQLDAAQRAELDGEVADRSRREVARLRLADRLRMARGAPVTVGLVGAGVVGGELVSAGPDWLLLGASRRSDILVVLSAVSWVTGVPAQAAEPAATPVVESRLDLGYVLRGIARDRAPVTVGLQDGTVLSGTIDRVGADFVDLAEHPTGEPRRAGAVRAVRTVASAAIAVVRPG